MAIKIGNSALAYLMMLLVARATTPAAFGVFATAFSLAVSASIVATVGQPLVILRFWPQWTGQNRPDKAGAMLRLSSLAVAVGLVVTAVAFLVAGVLAHFLALPWSFAAAATTALLTVSMGAADFLSAVLRARGAITAALAPRDIAWRLLLCAVFGAVAVMDGVLTAETVIALTGASLSVIVLIQLITTMKRDLPTSAPPAAALSHDRALIARTSFWFWLASASNIVAQYGGVVLIGSTASAELAGAYFAAHRIAFMLSLFLMAAELTATPLVSRYYHSGRKDLVSIITIVSGAVAGLGALTGFVFLIFFGDVVLALFDPSYTAVLPVLLILAFAQVINAATGPVQSTLRMIGREREALIIAVVIYLTSFAVQALSIPLFGLIGAAVALSGGMVLANIISFLYVTRILGMSLSSQALGLSEPQSRRNP